MEGTKVNQAPTFPSRCQGSFVRLLCHWRQQQSTLQKTPGDFVSRKALRQKLPTHANTALKLLRFYCSCCRSRDRLCRGLCCCGLCCCCCCGGRQCCRQCTSLSLMSLSLWCCWWYGWWWQGCGDEDGGGSGKVGLRWWW